MKHLAIAVCFLLALPAAVAEVTVTAEDGDLELQTGQTTSIDVNVTISCDEFVAAGADSVDVSIESDAPAEWGESADDITIEAGTECATGPNTATGSGEMSFTPTSDATGLATQTLTITATLGESTDDYDRTGDVWVAYMPGHTLTPDITFPYAFDGEKLVFNLTVDVAANSNTMVMFFPDMGSGDGSVSGLGHEQFFFDQGEDPVRTKTVTWEPPSTSWESANITFRHFSHCLNGGDIDSCDPQLEDNTTWTITNAGGGGGGGGSDAGEESPGAGIILGLLAVAIVALRRR